MTEDIWTHIDAYFARQLITPDESLEAALAANAAAGLPAIDVSPPQGKLLYLLAKLHGARRILEIGTLGGYSTIWLARALPAGGKISTLELEPRHAEIARSNFARTGVAGCIEVMVGPALASLATLRRQNEALFDLAFIDADKANTLEYFRHALELCRPGGLIVADNVVRKGHILDPHSTDPGVLGMRRFLEALAQENRVEATAIQTVGVKGYDGFLVARIRE